MTALAPDAWRATHVASLAGTLGAVGLVVDTLVRPQIVDLRIPIISISTCAAVAVWLLLTRRRASVVRGNVGFLIVVAAIVVALTKSTQELAEHDIAWVPFRQHQLGMITVALLAPPRVWVGVVAILGFVGAAVAQFALFEPDIRANLAYGDPWTTMMFAVFAIPLLSHRLRSFRVARDAARAQAQAEAFERLARAMVAFRDLANTPLQTCTNIVAILRTPEPPIADIADWLERAVARLVELESLTRPYADQLRWEAGDEAWDPRAILQGIAARGPG